jgi:hypothetical protein
MSRSKDKARAMAGVCFRSGKLVPAATLPPKREEIASPPTVKPENMPPGGKVSWIPGKGWVVIKAFAMPGLKVKGQKPMMVYEPLRTCKVCEDVVSESLARKHIRECWKIDIKNTDPIPLEPPAHLMKKKQEGIIPAPAAVPAAPSIDLNSKPPVPEIAPPPDPAANPPQKIVVISDIRTEDKLLCPLCKEPLQSAIQETILVNGKPIQVHKDCPKDKGKID